MIDDTAKERTFTGVDARQDTVRVARRRAGARGRSGLSGGGVGGGGSDNWAQLHVHVLPLFNHEGLQSAMCVHCLVFAYAELKAFYAVKI